MLYDPKWEKQAETKADPSSVASLIAWLETRPPEKKYDYHNCDGECLLGLYLNAIGLAWRSGGEGPGWELWNSELWDGPLGLISVGYPRTFGAALDRARRLTAEL